MPALITTPWQLEGCILALRAMPALMTGVRAKPDRAYQCFQREDLNGYLPIFKYYNVPALYNFRKEEWKWVLYRPKAKMLALDTSTGKASASRLFPGKKYRPSADLRDPTCTATTTRGDEKMPLAGLLRSTGITHLLRWWGVAQEGRREFLDTNNA